MTSRILFVGWDGADWDVLKPLSAAGYLPNFDRLCAEGRTGILRSTFPPHSVAAWSSFLTGLPAARHGVMDFRGCRPNAYFPEVPHTYESLPKPTILEVLSARGLRTLAANIPMTFPPPAVNGAVVAGDFLPKGAPFTHPPGLQARLDALGGFPTRKMRWTDPSITLGSLCEEAAACTAQQAKVFDHLLSSERWDVALFAFMAPDRVQHPGMYLLDPDHPWRSRDGDCALFESLAGVYGELDRALKNLLDRAQADMVFVASDHGFRSVWLDVNVNALLGQLGLLRLRPGASRVAHRFRRLRRAAGGRAVARIARSAIGLEARVDWDRTVAYCPSATTSGIRLNVLGRDRRGTVPRTGIDSQTERVVAALRDVRSPEGDPVFAWVLAAEEIEGWGQPAGCAPDVVFELARGLGARVDGETVFQPPGVKTGEHRAEGIVVGVGSSSSLPTGISDLPHRIAEAAGIEPAMWHPSPAEGLTPALTATEEVSVAEHLRGLGYIEE